MKKKDCALKRRNLLTERLDLPASSCKIAGISRFLYAQRDWHGTCQSRFRSPDGGNSGPEVFFCGLLTRSTCWDRAISRKALTWGFSLATTMPLRRDKSPIVSDCLKLSTFGNPLPFCRAHFIRKSPWNPSVKYRVKFEGKQSPPVSARKVISLFEKGFVGGEGIVTNEKGKSISVEQFVNKARKDLGNASVETAVVEPSYQEDDWLEEDLSQLTDEIIEHQEFGVDTLGEDLSAELDSGLFQLTDFKIKRTMFGRKILSYECPACESPLSSIDTVTDSCPNCGAGFRFLSKQKELDSRERAAQLGAARQPVKQWLITAVIIIGVIAPLMGRIIYDAVMTDSTNLCKVIFGLFLVALFRNFSDIKFIGREVATAREQVQALIKGGSVRDFVRKAENSLLLEHVTNLYEISRRNDNVSQDNLIVLLQSRINSRIRLTDIAGGMLVTLGLIGTILGLIASFGGIDTVMGNLGGDKTKMLDGFTETLGGMGTAFYTTLMGSILGGIILRVLSSVVDTNADALVGQIAELSEVYILPTLRKAASRRNH